jgi:hypothetical protein
MDAGLTSPEFTLVGVVRRRMAKGIFRRETWSEELVECRFPMDGAYRPLFDGLEIAAATQKDRVVVQARVSEVVYVIGDFPLPNGGKRSVSLPLGAFSLWCEVEAPAPAHRLPSPEGEVTARLRPSSFTAL